LAFQPGGKCWADAFGALGAGLINHGAGGGQIEAGRIDKWRRPIAAKASASSGRPASSPQNESRVPLAAQRATTNCKKVRKDTFSTS
jgi:hypothetical protein